MSDKPWAEPYLTIEARALRLTGALSVGFPPGEDDDLVVAETALRAARADAIEEAADTLDAAVAALSAGNMLREVLQHHAAAIRALKEHG